ncbi:AMP-binding protein [Aeromicrobium choanae]|uniref:Crotonobetaine/carnitine-CoA ligase n=1 Tax=Aeromicrobium choanae TaxID=1736691 RepID=A0A1T4Z1T6_9ACTN|nr:AMP-binding protein [Aeromicrobium choanae]SKB07823.1 crotonobetaine/carnitine-CoA ligase [Aeromicrobium choanae]
MDATRSQDLENLLDYDFATAVEALDHHVGVRPGRMAITYGETGEELTYGEFGRRTDAIAGNLARTHGVQPGTRVSVLSTNAMVAAASMYGLWKAGAVYAPVNYLYRGELLAYQLNDTRPDVLIVDEQLVPAVEQIKSDLHVETPLIVVASPEARDVWPHVFDDLLQPAERPDVTVSFNDPANIIYTSGTTGPSKGVVQSHRWVNGYTWIGRRILNEEDIVYNDLPLYHVGGAHYNVARALWVGAGLQLWDRFSPSDFWRRIKDGNCTTATLLDVMITWLQKQEPRDDDRENALNKVVLGPVPANHHEFAQRFGIDFALTGFGQSESGSAMMTLVEEIPQGSGTPESVYRGLDHATIRAAFEDAGMLVLDGHDPRVIKGILGTPSPFFEVAVLDEDDRPCVADQVGQLAMRPALPELIFTRYLAKPEATAQAFANLWFHTGDAARIDDLGVFHFVDRLGDRIRVRGENISGAQVEEQIARHRTVQLAAVIAVPSDEGFEDAIVAFVELVEGADFDEAALDAHCKAVMPKFMWPSRIVRVDKIPHTPTNKIEKYKLRQLFKEGQTL